MQKYISLVTTGLLINSAVIKLLIKMHITLSNLNGKTSLLTKGPEAIFALTPLFPDFDPNPASSS